jgi:hypothetical protein
MFVGCACDDQYLGKIFIPVAPYSNTNTGYINWTTDASCSLNWVNVNYIQPVHTNDQQYEYGFGCLHTY